MLSNFTCLPHSGTQRLSFTSYLACYFTLRVIFVQSAIWPKKINCRLQDLRTFAQAAVLGHRAGKFLFFVAFCSNFNQVAKGQGRRILDPAVGVTAVFQVPVDIQYLGMRVKLPENQLPLVVVVHVNWLAVLVVGRDMHLIYSLVLSFSPL